MRVWPTSLLVAALAACSADEPSTTPEDTGTAPQDSGMDAAVDLPGFDRPTLPDTGFPRPDTGPGDVVTSDISSDGGQECDPGTPCPVSQVCARGRCVSDLGPCTTNDDCRADSYCVSGVNRCAPYGSGQTDPSCTRDIRPGVFAPAVQCRFSEAPAGDRFPNHLHVLSTPMVADLRIYRAEGAPTRPSLIVVFDDGADGSSEEPTGLVRILDGRTCALQDNLADQLVSHSSPPAVADLDGDGVPEIVAFKAGGGLVAFRWERTPEPDAGVDASADTGAPSDGDLDAGEDAELDGDATDASVEDVEPRPPSGRWRVWWRSTARDGTTPFNPTGGGWAGPTIADVDDDGQPEVLRHGMVFHGRTGALLGGQSQQSALTGYSAGAFSVVQDVDEDGAVELVTGAGVFAWSPGTRDWVREPYYVRSGCSGSGCADGHVAVANFGDWPGVLVTDPGIPEIAVVSGGFVRIDTIEGRTVFGPVALPGGGTGGAPTVADFDGDGRPEVAAAGARAYSVFDPDCAMTVPLERVGGRCGTATSAGVLWSRPSQDASSNVTGSTSFDFEGDGRVEAVYADECFARVYDGQSGEVLFSQHHSSCTWYENPVVADVDGDFRAEIVVGSNFNCGSATTGIACPGVGARSVDVQFAGIRCFTERDCFSGACVEGFCRCSTDAQCCPSTSGGECTYVCAPPPEGTPGAGNTCRASRPVGVRGIRVYSDVADRWVRSRLVWNQHAYNVTNVLDDGRVPRGRSVAANWRDRTLNNFRTNVQGSAETLTSPDVTAGGGTSGCLASGAARLFARACNRGTAPVADGTPVGFYDGDPASGGVRVCQSRTPRALAPGQCVELSCEWATPPTESARTVTVVADDDRTTTECREGNNLATIQGVLCRPPG